MEEWLSLCCIALSTVLALWFLKLNGGTKKFKKQQLPPGPWTLPVIGSLHHVVSLLPHRRMMDMSRQHGPLMHLVLGEVPTVIVSSAEAAELVMRTNDLAFATRPGTPTQDIFGCGGKDVVFAPYGEHWRQMRKVCVVEFLSSRQVKRMEGIRAEEVGSLLRSIAAAAAASTSGGAAIINFSQEVAALSNDVVTRAVFGGKFARQREYIRELGRALELMGGSCLVDIFPSSRLARWLSHGGRSIKKSSACIKRIISGIIEERQAARAAASDGACSSTSVDENFLDALLRLQQEGSLEIPLTTDAIGAVLSDMFAGGTETIATTLAWAMSELVRSPEIMAKAQQEVREVLGEGRSVITNSDLTKLRYPKLVIKEVLRLHPASPLIPRAAREDCTVMGYDIPKGTNVYINVFAISRDPKNWNSPGEFKPERFEDTQVNFNGTYFEFIPFGAGRRQCTGIQFTLSLAVMALANFLYHFDWKLPDASSLASFDMSEKFGITVCRRYDLKLRAVPHVWPNATLSE
ncbi:hypothetical protein CFC21_020633 [Triticum aestivum]|uniref:Cytochrome P450 n=3 Tax=Triticum TaxID=4564 RepID=A0A3B6BZC7_WHEAT|nr:zealexin A1 synthase-like [Triticum dicoccoides]XP_044321334.1 zealexin A1 synthase-like [Triticum aestivum]KAF7005516.1 hypothetical protein CFC21_020633 [Triticum aestivum]